MFSRRFVREFDNMKKIAVFLLKWALVLLIFVWLFYRAKEGDAFERIRNQQIHYGFLLAGFFLTVLSTLLTFIRWQWLVRALNVPLSLSEALRLGAIGYVFNFSPMGIVGGDLVKGFLLAKKAPEAKSACAVSVIADRVIGLYAMFLLGLIALFATGFWRETTPAALFSTRLMIGLTVVSTLGTILLLIPESSHSFRRRMIRALPWIGTLFEKLFDAAILYRKKGNVLLFSLLATFAVHILFAAGFWCYALGLFGFAPSLMNHFVIYPTANCGSMIPLAAGPLETFLDILYPLFPVSGGAIYEAGYGSMIGLISRFGTIVIAAAGGFLCLLNRSDIGEVLTQMRNDENGASAQVGGKG